MDQERIKALIELLAESDLIELSLTEGDSTLRLFKDAQGVAFEPAAPAIAPVASASNSTTANAPAKPVTSAVAKPPPAADEVKASLYGVLHLTPAVGEAPFVQLGDSVEAGQTLAILEAMKMFHPLKADRPGTVKAILADSGTEVEAGQPLFRIG